MQAALVFTASLVLLASCVATGPAGPPPSSTTAAARIELSAGQRAAIGRQIWQNECGGTVDGLTTWNAGEEFPSLGIGHFIWYPRGFNGRFRESWPEFVAYARQRGAQPPAIALQADCPWSTKAAFTREFHSPAMTSLRRWLAGSFDLQTDFIVQRSLAALPGILAAAPAGERDRIRANYHRVATTPQGVYALIDYVNFKGDGTSPSERYRGQGWGLLQVLESMRPTASGPAAADEFAHAAIRVLERRVANAPPERGEKRWMPGWRNRCLTYSRPL